MAIFHLSAQIISRSTGRSSVGASAYRAGVDLVDERTGEKYRYARRTGVNESVILAPENSPAWAYERSRLWNEVEAIEKRKDAQLARELNIALPVELNNDQKKALMLGYVQENFVAKGMVADVAFHDLGSGNPHAHIMLTTRDISGAGFGQKNRSWNDKALLEQWREQWAVSVNRTLERNGIEMQVDHRTLEAQQASAVERGDELEAIRLNRIAQTHQGPKPGIDLRAYQDEALKSRQDALEQVRIYEEAHKSDLEKQRLQAQKDAEHNAWVMKADKGLKYAEETYREKAGRVFTVLAKEKELTDQEDAISIKLTDNKLALERVRGQYSKADQAVQRWKKNHPLRLKMEKFGLAKPLEELRKNRGEFASNGQALKLERGVLEKRRESLKGGHIDARELEWMEGEARKAKGNFDAWQKLRTEIRNGLTQDAFIERERKREDRLEVERRREEEQRRIQAQIRANAYQQAQEQNRRLVEERKRQLQQQPNTPKRERGFSR